jgi:hypothetical protein
MSEQSPGEGWCQKVTERSYGFTCPECNGPTRCKAVTTTTGIQSWAGFLTLNRTTDMTLECGHNFVEMAARAKAIAEANKPFGPPKPPPVYRQEERCGLIRLSSGQLAQLCFCTGCTLLDMTVIERLLANDEALPEGVKLL